MINKMKKPIRRTGRNGKLRVENDNRVAIKGIRFFVFKGPESIFLKEHSNEATNKRVLHGNADGCIPV